MFDTFIPVLVAAAAEPSAATEPGLAEMLIWGIPGLPLLAAALIAAFGHKLKGLSHIPCVAGIAGAFICAFVLFTTVYGGQHSVHVGRDIPWIQAGRVDVRFGIEADALTAMMCVMVTFIATFIALYASGYMKDDPGYPRFFGAVSLFVFSMTVLVLGDNFLMMFAGWEGVGLCSYLLIGFWFSKPEAAAAARKAFLVTRLGDVGLFLGVLLLWHTFGSVDYATVFAGIEKMDKALPVNETILTVAALLLFCGAAGKSAQFPLHVWLPDAMEGPTPVSALIHAATMVTAGVYLLARCTVLFAAAPFAQVVVAVLGGVTALLAALIALTQNDLKRVLAYSTLSQLGYMFMALGCALSDGTKFLIGFAVIAAVFHLFTHAFFKALLFLGAGSVMHSMGHVIDMRRLGGLRQVMPRTHITFLCGSLALAGFPLLAGFWSKDEILDAVFRASEASTRYSNTYFALLIIALVTAGLTAFYTFRAYFKTFWGELRIPEEAYHHHGHHDDHAHDSHGGHDSHGAHATEAPKNESHAPAEKRTEFESPNNMTIPLLVLSVFAVTVGAVVGPTMLFAGFVGHANFLPHEEHAFEPNLLLMGIGTALGLGGITLAYLFYVAQPAIPNQIAKSAQALYQVSLNKFFLDEIYYAVVVWPMEWLAKTFGKFDWSGIDWMVNFIGALPKIVGELFRPIQNGLVQFYALAMVLCMTALLVLSIYKL
jgi:NADH-quinone oxidoreductase subunit L